MTEYDLNKQMYKNLPMMTENAVTIANTNLYESLKKQKGSWYMLLSRDGRDYTVFDNTSQNRSKLTFEVFDLLTERGKFKGVYIQDDYADFWIECKLNGEVQLYKLFPYDWGIIKV